jgi:hypothetical protein
MMMGLFKKKHSDEEILEKAKEITFKKILQTPPTNYDAIECDYVGWILSNVDKNNYERIRQRRDIEEFSQKVLRALEEGEVCSEKVGDADYIIEMAEKWGQLGAETRQSDYRNAKGKVRTIMQQCYIDKYPKAQQIARKLMEVRPNIELRAKDDGFRGILVQKAKGRQVCVWASQTDDQHEVGESHDPEHSFYEGFSYYVENGAGGPLAEIADFIFDYYEKLWASAVPVQDLLRNVTREPNGGNGKSGPNAKISDFPVVPEDQKKE